MLKKVIEYTDFDGNPAQDTFYFNLTKAELAQAEMETKGGWAAQLSLVAMGGDGGLILKTFEDILRRTYGVRSQDGKSFHKSPELWNDFKTSAAYSTLFMELVTNAESAAEFLINTLPADLVQEAGGAKKFLADIELPSQVLDEDVTVSRAIEVAKEVLNGQVVSPKDARKLSKSELVDAMVAKNLLRQAPVEEILAPSTPVANDELAAKLAKLDGLSREELELVLEKLSAKD